MSNEGWDALAFMVIALCAAAVLIYYVHKTGRFPWDSK